MTPIGLAALLAAAVAPSMPGSPAPVPVLPCAPPLDTPLRLVVRQSLWLADGQPRRVSIERRIVFTRDPTGGFALDAALAGLSVEPPDPDAEARLRAGMGTPGGPPLRLLLDPLLRISAIRDMESEWQAYVARQRALREAMAAAGRPTARADAMLAALAAMAPAERLALLAAFAAPLLHHCGTVPPADAAMAADGVAIRIVGDSAGMQEVSDYRVDPATGLMLSLDRAVTSPDAPLRPLKESWTLTPE